MNFYNENEHFAAERLRNLISNKLLPEGYVNEKDIKKSQPKIAPNSSDAISLQASGAAPEHSSSQAGPPIEKLDRLLSLPKFVIK